MALVEVTASVGVRWRDAAGRFAHLAPSSLLDAATIKLGEEIATRLRDATPTGKTGNAKRGWRADWLPAQHAVRVTNSQGYAWFLITGTRPHNIPGAFGEALPFGTHGRFDGKFHPGMKPHEAMARVIGDVGPQAQLTLRQAGQAVIASLTGQGV